MDSFSTLTHRKTHRVRGPRPYSWISSSSSSDSSSNEYGDVWPWTLGSSNLSRESTLHSSTSSQSSVSSTSSSSSHPVRIPDPPVEYDGKPYYRHGRRRKPAGPRAPRNGSCFDVRKLGLWINTSPLVIPQFQRELSPITPVLTPVPSTDMLQSPPIAPSTMNSPTNFLLDWDAIFEILGCSEGPPRVRKAGKQMDRLGTRMVT